jgi:hypothetical protein
MNLVSPGSRILLAGLFTSGLLGISGCVFAPEQVSWKSEQSVIAPPEPPVPPSGTLFVETVYLGSEEGQARRMNFHLYDDKGTYLTHYFDDSISGISLPPGRYVVVSCVMFTNKQVQVLIRGGCATRVTLNDLKAAPEAK